MNFYKLTKDILSDRNKCIEWCISNGLLPKEKFCDICNSKMILDINEQNFRCRKNGHDIKRSLKLHTWFNNSKLSIESILILTYNFAIGNTKYEHLKREASLGNKVLTNSTIADWISFCREVCMLWLDHDYETQGMIGGVGHTVQVDESKVGKRKYNRGRLVKGNWILGMIDLGTETNKCCKVRLEICPNNKRDAVTLLELIKKHVKPESVIVSDLWKAYDCLEKHGYRQMRVNHSLNFVDPKSGAHTQNIESEWRQMKRGLHTGGHHRENLAEYLCEYLFRKMIRVENLDPFDAFIKAINFVYKV